MDTGTRKREDYLGTTSVNIGAGALTVAEGNVEEFGNAYFKRTVITLTDCPVAVGNTIGISFGGKKLYDFPEGRFQILGGNCDLVVDASGDAGIVQTGSGDVSLGGTITADGVLSGTEVDIMASTALTDPFVAGIGSVAGSLVKNVEFDGSTTPKDLCLNIIIDDLDVADGHDGEVLVSGRIVVCWAFYGDR